MRLKDRRIAHRQVIDEVNVALFPHSGIDFFLHESIEMVSSYNRSNRLRMQNKVRKNNKYNSRTPKPFSKPATTHAMSPSDGSRKGVERFGGRTEMLVWLRSKEENANFVKSSSDEAVTGAPSREGRSGHVQGMSGVRKVRKSSEVWRY